MDITPQLHSLVEQLRTSQKPEHGGSKLQPPTQSSPRASLQSAIASVTAELAEVKQAVLRDARWLLWEFCVAGRLLTQADDSSPSGGGCGPNFLALLQPTEALLSGAAQHVEQLRALLSSEDELASSSRQQQQELAHLHCIVEAMFSQLQEGMQVLTELQRHARHAVLQAAATTHSSSSSSKEQAQGDEVKPPCISSSAGVGLRNRNRQSAVPAPSDTQWGLTEEHSMEDVGLLRAENAMLAETLCRDWATEAQEVERSAASLSALASLFTEKVDEQQAQIEALLKTAERSTALMEQAATEISSSCGATSATSSGWVAWVLPSPLRALLNFRCLMLLIFTSFTLTLLTLHAILP